jgi:molybdenum cofactor cytidylyltransferase
MRPFVSGLVLAAGGSTRLGQPKQLLPLGSTTLLGRVISEVKAASGIDEVVVVIGGAATEVRRRVDFGGARVVENPEFGQGCASSYRMGIAALDTRAEAVSVLLGDQPGVGPQVIDAVVDEWRRMRDRIVLAAYRGREGHPLVFARALFGRLIALRGDKAAWKIVDAHRDQVRLVPIDRPLPSDVNTWQQYEALLRNAVRPDA